MPGCESYGAESIKRKISSINERLSQLEEKNVSVSVGVAFSPDGFSQDLYDKADKALYAVKEKGRASNTISRAHVADTLKAKGYAPSRQAAFRKYLVEGQPGYVPPIGVSAIEAITRIKKAGGLAVIAHPGIVTDHWNFPAWKEAGLDGIEVFYPAHSFSIRQELLHLADKYGLFATAGSDYHGPKGGRCATPGMQIPQNHYNKLLCVLF